MAPTPTHTNSLPAEEVECFISNPDPATKDYVMQHTAYRIKDPRKSLDFYSRVLGMSLLSRLDFPECCFTLFYMGYADTSKMPEDQTQRMLWTFKQPYAIELLYLYGTDTDECHKGYHDGNSEPKGFAHIAISTPDVYVACERFEKLGVKLVQKPDGGPMKKVAYIQDPDGYWIEIFSSKMMDKCLEC